MNGPLPRRYSGTPSCTAGCCPRLTSETGGRSGIHRYSISGLITQDLPGPGAVFLGAEWRFEKPVRIGEQITGEVEVLEVRTDKPIWIPAPTGTILTCTSMLD
ncbi:hypothetical protein [Sciscionella marina]|uniref:hypothetical protein n=1 Tax=Sciscionella marina TaxID=508770 RepID=UPI0012F6C6D7|nr:hypothetical protein [Sciscionella marina]